MHGGWQTFMENWPRCARQRPSNPRASSSLTLSAEAVSHFFPDKQAEAVHAKKSFSPIQSGEAKMQTPVARNLHILSSTRVTPRRPPSPAKASHAWPPSAGSNNSVRRWLVLAAQEKNQGFMSHSFFCPGHGYTHNIHTHAHTQCTHILTYEVNSCLKTSAL